MFRASPSKYREQEGTSTTQTEETQSSQDPSSLTLGFSSIRTEQEAAVNGEEDSLAEADAPELSADPTDSGSEPLAVTSGSLGVDFSSTNRSASLAPLPEETHDTGETEESEAEEDVGEEKRESEGLEGLDLAAHRAAPALVAVTTR